MYSLDEYIERLTFIFLRENCLNSGLAWVYTRNTKEAKEPKGAVLWKAGFSTAWFGSWSTHSFPTWNALKEQSQCDAQAVPNEPSVPLRVLWIPAGFSSWAWGILLSLQAARAWATFRLLCALVAEHLGSAWGKSCGGFIRWISPQRQMGSFTGAWEVKSIHRHANVSAGHVQGCFWECQLCYPTPEVFVHHLAVCDPRWRPQQAKRVGNTQIFFFKSCFPVDGTVKQ